MLCRSRCTASVAVPSRLRVKFGASWPPNRSLFETSLPRMPRIFRDGESFSFSRRKYLRPTNISMFPFLGNCLRSMPFAMLSCLAKLSLSWEYCRYRYHLFFGVDSMKAEFFYSVAMLRSHLLCDNPTKVEINKRLKNFLSVLFNLLLPPAEWYEGMNIKWLTSFMYMND